MRICYKEERTAEEGQDGETREKETKDTHQSTKGNNKIIRRNLDQRHVRLVQPGEDHEAPLVVSALAGVSVYLH